MVLEQYGAKPFWKSASLVPSFWPCCNAYENNFWPKILVLLLQQIIVSTTNFALVPKEIYVVVVVLCELKYLTARDFITIQ